MENQKNGTPLIELNDIYKVYQMGDEEVRANDGISLTICKGEFVVYADEHYRSAGCADRGNLFFRRPGCQRYERR